MTTTAGTYHRVTSYSRYEMGGHGLDWSNRPDVYKTYQGAEYLPLPRPGGLPRVAIQHIADPSSQTTHVLQPLTIDRLSVILALAYGITGHVRSGGENFYYRSAPSAGALYPVEIYMAANNIDGLGPGLYHYDVSEHRLCLLRSEDIMPFPDACVEKSKVDSPPHVSFFFSAITFRSAWKYKKRAFRYLLLDTGHVLENLMMPLRAEGLSATVHYDIHRDMADRFLGLDPEREICFASVRIAGGEPFPPDVSKELTGLPRNVINAGQVSPKEVLFREIEEMAQAASTLPAHNRQPADMINQLGLSPDDWQQIKEPRRPFGYDFSDAVMSRRSRRNFISDELSGETFFELLTFLSQTSKLGQPAPHLPGNTMSTGVIVQNVKGVSSGFYLCDFQNNRWGQVLPGQLCSVMAAACLDQQWLQSAALHFCFLANLDLLDQTWGARGYQYAMLDAGRLGQSIYLAATALGLGCCGIGALYDDEARSLLGLNQTSALLYLVAAGPVKR